jgi:hypothetical protein
MPEQLQPPFYEELFTGFVGLAALHGAVQYDQLDPHQPPGKDGALTPDGQRAHRSEYEIPEAELPDTLRQRGIDLVKIGYSTVALVGDDIWPERVSVHLHEALGITKRAVFRNEGVISATVDVEADETPDLTQGSTLSAAEQDEIRTDMFSGRRRWLSLDGPAGDFARELHVFFSADDEPSADDIELLRFVLSELETKR